MTVRSDAAAKATGTTTYAGDIRLPDMCHVAVVRSEEPCAEIIRIRTDMALRVPGVLAVLTAQDVASTTYGRRVRDIPILARDSVRYVGERVAAVVAENRRIAESAASLVEVDYSPLPAVPDVDSALAAEAPLVHERAWDYPNAVITASDPPNVQCIDRHGDAATVARHLETAPVVVDRTFTTASGHAGYIEPQVCLARISEGGVAEVWATDKGPYRMRAEIAHCLSMDLERIIVHPVAIGGDFGGKGSYGDVALCIEAARLVGRPARLGLRYSEDLQTGIPRHPTRMHLQMAADSDGRLRAVRLDSIADGGAYAGYKPRPGVDLHGVAEVGSSYRIPALHVESRIVYTNSLPRGHVRTPGSPQATFAFESLLDELAAAVGVSPVEIRRRNLLRPGDPNPSGHQWEEVRALEALEAALTPPADDLEIPPGWLTGTGIGVFDRGTTGNVTSSMRIAAEAHGMLRIEVPFPETGTGSHTVVREAVARGLGRSPDSLRVVQVSTGALEHDAGVGGSRMTVAVDRITAAAVKAWHQRGESDAVTVQVQGDVGSQVTSFCTQVARIAVDASSGEMRVLELVTSVDVADVVNPAAHQMQIDGGAVMGIGFACLEDLQIDEGRVWAASLGEFKLPSTRDVPRLRTVLVEGGTGVGRLNVKAVGELSNVPAAAAIANAIAHADPHQDLLPALIAANARATVAGPRGTRTCGLANGFFRGFLETSLDEGEIVTEIRLPAPGRRAAERYVRFTPASRDDYPTVSVAARLTLAKDGSTGTLALALGGVGPAPVSAWTPDRGPLPTSRSSEVLDAVSQAVREVISPNTDARGSSEYKSAMADLWSRRVVSDLLASLTGRGTLDDSPPPSRRQDDD